LATEKELSDFLREHVSPDALQLRLHRLLLLPVLLMTKRVSRTRTPRNSRNSRKLFPRNSRKLFPRNSRKLLFRPMN
jgi:hypothetical protein